MLSPHGVALNAHGDLFVSEFSAFGRVHRFNRQLANRHIQMHTAGVARSIELYRHPEGAISPAKAQLVSKAIMNACDPEKMGRNQGDFTRLFMVPGMAHCGGGAGPNTFDSIGALEAWREKGTAPAQITAFNPQTGFSRPVCPYPQYAKYKGTGNRKDAANWSCVAP